MPKIKSVPFQFKNELKDGKHVMTLSGTVRKKYWSGDDVINAKDIREALDQVTDDIVIKLNSPGGDVFEGIEIYNYLKDHSSNVTVEVTGVAGSAATFITSGADDVVMNIGTTMMIHEAATFAWGNKTDIKKTLNALETIDDSILSIYEEKTGQSIDQLKIWMDEAKWFTADEAVEYGFASLVKRDESKSEPEDVITMVNNAVAVAMANMAQPVTNEVKEEPTQKSLIARLRKGE